MVKTKKDQNSRKYVEPTTKGHCPYCKKAVKSLDHHIHDKHLDKKPKKR